MTWGNLGLSREFHKKLFGPLFYSWWNFPLRHPNLQKTHFWSQDFFSKEFLSNSRNTIGIGIGGGGNVGFGVSGGIPIGGKVINQTLTIDFIDSDKDALIWQAVVNGELNEKANPQQKEDYYFGIIRKALKAFPPSKN